MGYSILKNLTFFILFITVLFSGCESEPEDPIQELIDELGTANSFAEQVQLIADDTGIPVSGSSRYQGWLEYDAVPSDYPSVFNWSNSDQLVNGRYDVYISPDETGLAPLYPNSVAWIEFIGGATSSGVLLDPQKMSTTSFDRVNNTFSEGISEAFYGIKDANSDVLASSGQYVVPAVILERGIVSLGGENLYKYFKVFEGFFTSLDGGTFTSNGGPIYPGSPGSLFFGHYEIYNTERLSSNELVPPLGLLIEYDHFLIRG